jgi:hypothetical protein
MQSYVFMERPSTPIALNDLKAVIREQKFDAIIVARLTKAERKTTYFPCKSIMERYIPWSIPLDIE